MNKTYLYPYSAEEARRRNEMSLWRASHKANLACKEEIELAIGTHFDGTHLEEGCAEGVIREYESNGSCPTRSSSWTGVIVLVKLIRSGPDRPIHRCSGVLAGSDVAPSP